MSVDYAKLKTNLNLIMHRLKLVEKKKMELNQKARRTIGEFLIAGKVDRARIRVEQIIREDYVIEAMDLVESYCDFLLSRFGQLQNTKVVEDSIACAISSLIWVTPRFESDLPELKVISDQLGRKYGKTYVQAVCDGQIKTVNETLIKKMGTEVPPGSLVEKYLVEIAKDQKIDYKPDPRLLKEQDMFSSGGYRLPADSTDDDSVIRQPGEAPQSGFSLIDLGDHYPKNPITNTFSAYGQPPPLPSEPPIAPEVLHHFNDNVDASAPSGIPIGFNLTSMEETGTGSSINQNASMSEKPVRKTETKHQSTKPETNATTSKEEAHNSGEGPPPNYESVVNKIGDSTQYLSFGADSPYGNQSAMNDTLPELPPVPKSTNSNNTVEASLSDERLDLDDLTRRFEDLKNKTT